MYIFFFGLDCNTDLSTMNSPSQAVKDKKFRAKFKPVPPPNLEALEDNDEGTEPLVTRNVAEQLQTPKERQFGTTILTRSKSSG